MDALEELIAAGPEPGYKVKALVLKRHQDILTARQLMRKWQDITVALGFEARQWRQIAGVFRRVDAGVRAGKLMPPGKASSGGGFRQAHNSNKSNNVGNNVVAPDTKPDGKPAFNFEAARIDKNR